jgi:hypothetical protein
MAGADYFTAQPGGAYANTSAGIGARIHYPNGLKRLTRAIERSSGTTIQDTKAGTFTAMVR